MEALKVAFVTYGFTIVDGECSVDEINAELQRKIESLLAGHRPVAEKS